MALSEVQEASVQEERMAVEGMQAVAMVQEERLAASQHP